MSIKPTHEELESLLKVREHELSIAIEEHKQVSIQHAGQSHLLSSVLNSYESPVFSLDCNYCYTSFNQAHADEMKAIYGTHIKLGSCIHDHLASEDIEVSKLNLEKVLQGNTLVEHAFYGGDVRRYYEVIHNPIKGTANNITGLSVFVRDITKRKQLEEERDKLINSLQEALNEIKTLKGLIPICSYCHNIRDNEGAWERIETYISKHSDAQFSHGICPRCLPKYFSDDDEG